MKTPFRTPNYRLLYGELILWVLALVVLFPIFMSLMNSVKTNGEIIGNIMAWPKQMLLSNYGVAFHRTRFVRSFFNTFLIAGVGVSGIVLFAAMAGYKLSRTRGSLSTVFFSLFVFAMLIPFHSIMITLTRVAKQVGVQGSPLGLGIMYIGLGVPMAVFLFHGFVKSIPLELDEAAVMDGCSEYRFFFTVMFPLLLPISATVIILNTLWIWNDFLLPLLMLTNSDHYTILLSTNMLFGQYNNNDWSSILATLILAMVPMVLLYVFFQKYITKGIVDGALKE